MSSNDSGAEDEQFLGRAISGNRAGTSQNSNTKTWEVEQKFVVNDARELLAGLAQAGFTEQRVERHRDTYFRHPCRDFRATDEAFRLRQQDERTYVTYKGQRLDTEVKTRPEIELLLHSEEFEQWGCLFEKLGFAPLPVVCKTRIVYQAAGKQAELDATSDFVVTLDDVEQLGQFAEVELLVDELSQLSAAQTRVQRLAERLSLTEVQPKSYLSLLLSKLGIE